MVLEPMENAGWPVDYWERLDALAPLPGDFSAPEDLPETPHRDHALKDLDEGSQ